MRRSAHRSLLASAILLAVAPLFATPASAGDCAAQKGKALFDDSFTSGTSFPADEQAKFGPNGLEMTVGQGENGWAYAVSSAHATDGDFCAVAMMPAPLSEANSAAVGLVIRRIDDENMLTLYVFSDNTVQIERLAKDADPALLLNEQNEAVNAAVGTPVSVRAVIQGETLTPYVNGVAFKPVQIGSSPNANSFGPYARLDKEAEKTSTFTFKSLRVTDGKN